MDASNSNTEPVMDKRRMRSVRWVVFGLAAATVLGWGCWFISLVVIELNLENRVAGPGSYQWDFGGESDRWMTYRQSIEVVSHGFDIPIQVDWEALGEHGIVADDRVSRWRTDPSDPVFQPARYHVFGAGGTDVRGSFTLDRLKSGLECNLDPARGIAIDWRIEGSQIVLTTTDRAPRFDASATARRWWHGLREWWEGL